MLDEFRVGKDIDTDASPITRAATETERSGLGTYNFNVRGLKLEGTRSEVEARIAEIVEELRGYGADIGIKSRTEGIAGAWEGKSKSVLTEYSETYDGDYLTQLGVQKFVKSNEELNGLSAKSLIRSLRWHYETMHSIRSGGIGTQGKKAVGPITTAACNCPLFIPDYRYIEPVSVVGLWAERSEADIGKMFRFGQSQKLQLLGAVADQLMVDGFGSSY